MSNLTIFRASILCMILGFGFYLPSSAGVDVVAFDDPGQEALYQEMIRELRCLVCQNQNLADSNAELAQDLRRKTVELVKAGKDREAIVDYMVSRYGDFVLYHPRFNAKTAFLWISPLILFLFLTWWVLRWRRRMVAAPTAYSAHDLAHARNLLRKTDDHRDSYLPESTE